MAEKNNQIEAGSLLISEPFMNDPNFLRTVVLMCEHNQNGSLGFVLNKEVAGLKLVDVMEDVGKGDFPLYLGGPVDRNLLQFIHSLGNEIEHSIEIAKGVYWGGDFDQLKFLLREDFVRKSNIKFFLGYSGWSEGQLEDELNQNAWMVTKSDQRGIFGDPDQLWKNTLQKMGGKYRIISNYPTDPRLN